MKNANISQIKVVDWDSSSNNEVTRSQNNFIVIKPQDSIFIESIKKQIKLLEYNEKFHKEVNSLREKYNYISKLPAITDEDKNNKQLVLKNLMSLKPSMKIDEDSVELAKKYMQGELPHSFATYLAYNFFPIEPSLLGLTFLKPDITDDNTLLISIDRKMGVKEFIRQAKILFPHMKKYINKMKRKKFSQSKSNAERNLRLLDLHAKGFTYDEISEKIKQYDDYLEPESVRITIFNLLKIKAYDQ